MQLSKPERTGYVLKIYPRFSETFIVTEILAREAAGEQLEIFSLRAPFDPRFHPELARVQAPVTYVSKPQKVAEGWSIITAAQATIPEFSERFARLLPWLSQLDPTEVHQGVELATLLTQHGITHLHAHFGSIAARTADIASALTGIPFSFTAHAKDIFHESVDLEVLRGLIARAHHVVTVSNYNLDYLGRLSPADTGKIHRVYNGLELDRFKYRTPGPVHSPLRIAAVGRLVEKKGFSQLIDAAVVLKRDGVQLEVRIAGGGELHDQLHQHILDNGLENTVTLLGPRTQLEVVELLRWADIFAAPCMVGADGNADGLPTVLLEAMAMGVPCIASDVTGIPEVMVGPDGEQTGILTRSENLQSLVQALKYASSPGFKRAIVARAARTLIEDSFDARWQSARLGALAAGTGIELAPAPAGRL